MFRFGEEEATGKGRPDSNIRMMTNEMRIN